MPHDEGDAPHVTGKPLINKRNDEDDEGDVGIPILFKRNGGWIPREERITLFLKHGLSQEEAEAAAREWEIERLV